MDDLPVDLPPELYPLPLEAETGLAGISRIVKDVDLAAVGTDLPTEDERDARGFELIEEVLQAELVGLVEDTVVRGVGVVCLEGLLFVFESAMVLDCLLTAVEESNLVIFLKALTFNVTGSCIMFSTFKTKT